jgi:hypothetical protein
MYTYYFSLSLNYEQCQQLYLPGNNSVVIVEEQGKRIQIPTKNLRPFVSQTGLKGRFRLLINNDKKLVSLEKMN